jgi:hypothetical protein
MSRCLHVHESGFQCVSEAIEPTEFCDAHQKVLPFEYSGTHNGSKLLLRFVAFILLIMFLLPLIYSLRTLYFGPPVKTQEVW